MSEHFTISSSEPIKNVYMPRGRTRTGKQGSCRGRRV